MRKIALIIGIIFVSAIIFLLVALYYLSQKTGRSYSYFPKTFLKASKNDNVPDRLNIMIFGLDRRDDWLEKSNTTDTIIFSQVNFPENKIKLFSFPRDLWDYYTNTKINQIYPMSLEKTNTQEKFNYIAKEFASISGQPINRVLVLTTENLKQLADILGGIDLYLQNGFKDEKYPNQDYILNPKSGAPIYKTVEFKSGFNHLDSSNITEFVRSRKSSETAASGGTDLGRIERQQQLINALIDKLKTTISQNPKTIFELYKFWGNLEQNFSDTEFISYAIKFGLNLKNMAIIRYPISSGEDPKKDLLYHPTKFINKQWVFIPQDKNYQLLHQYLSQSLASY
ncbi:MAG: LCP family protein [Candidatus Shapirobacteria bacterium]